MTQDVLELLLTRSSVRAFTPEEVPASLISQALGMAVRAPTSFNFQPYSFIVVRDRKLAAELAQVAGGQPHIRQAPVLVLVCAEVARVGRACGLVPDADGGVPHDLQLSCVIDASLAGMCAALAAESLGLGTVMIGGVRNDPTRVRELLGTPEGVHVLFALCMGWPDERPAARPRIDPDLAVHADRYDGALAERAARYDTRTLHKPGGPVTAREAEAWRQELAKGISRVHRLFTSG
ncbi:nitroreductase family protein [Streptomyces griseorubiginosus]|uniref:nitroreductase family protein n=1 Tax=Streptomyces griseorubiginosus TaxID=67304 RepID=UPI0033A70843